MDQSDKSLAPGQYAGYSLQTTRCLARLLEAPPGSLVSVEVLGDVGVLAPDGQVLVEEDKSSIESNPVSDRAVGLWKTFSNWVDAARGGHLVPCSTQFEIFVPKVCTGSIVTQFSKLQGKLALV